MVLHVMRFTTTLLLTIADVEREIPITVEGDYQRAERAFTYPGEYAPTDPPTCEGFELNAVYIEHGPYGEGKPRPQFHILSLLSDEQREGLQELGISEAAAQREEMEYTRHEAREEARQEWADMLDERDEL
jgi:hypothetical protein